MPEVTERNEYRRTWRERNPEKVAIQRHNTNVRKRELRQRIRERANAEAIALRKQTLDAFAVEQMRGHLLAFAPSHFFEQPFVPFEYLCSRVTRFVRGVDVLLESEDGDVAQ